MESQFENDEQRKDFNIWLNEVYIRGGYGRKKEGLFITVKTPDKAKSLKTLIVDTKEFNEWLSERIKEYKELNLLK